MNVAIIGAGFAGLAAARALTKCGIGVEIFEATAHAGGRARSAHATVSLGPEFVHGRPDVTLAVVREAQLELDEIDDVHHRWRDGALREDPKIWQRFGKLLEGATRDESAHAYLERMVMRPDDADLFAMLVEGFYAAPLDDISVRSIASDASGAGEEAQQYRIRGGYHRMVKHMRRGMPIRYGHVVTAIDWGRDCVIVDHTHGAGAFDRVIVTVSAGVLRAGSIQFTPELTDQLEALEGLAMGHVVKVVTCFREPVWPKGLEFVHNPTTRFPTLWLRSAPGDHQLTAWAGGPHARALANYDEIELGEVALDEAAGTLHIPRRELEAARLHHHHHDYRRDPFALGAYSYTRVGGEGAADFLARPIGGRVFLAGEATDEAYEGSVAGAIASGLRAARQVITAAPSVPRTLFREIRASR